MTSGERENRGCVHSLRLYWAARAFGRSGLRAGERRDDFAEAVEDPLVAFLLIEEVRAVAPDALFFLVGQVEAGQYHDRQIDEPVVETHELEHFDARSIVVEADVENHRVERRRRLLQPLERCVGMRGHEHVVAIQAEEVLEHVPDGDRVLDHQNRSSSSQRHTSSSPIRMP